MNKIVKIIIIFYAFCVGIIGCNPEIQEFIDPIPVATTAVNIKTTEFTATWQPLLGAKNYILEVATDGTFESEFLVAETPIEVQDTSHTLKDLIVAHTYYYRLVANLTTGEQTKYSDVVTVSTLGMPTPVALAATEIGSSQFTLRWQKVLEAKTYEVEIGSDIDFSESTSLQRIVTKDTFAIVKNNLKADQDYFYRILARDDETVSAYSNVVHLTTDRLTQPIITEVPDNVRDELTFQWNSVVGASHYLVEFTTDPLFLDSEAYLVKDSVVQQTSFTVYNLIPNTSYYYRVRAHSDKSLSDYSDKRKVTTLPLLVPELLQATNLSSTSFTMNWTAVTNIDTYSVEISTYPDFTILLQVINDVADTTFTIEDLTGDQTYYCRVRAKQGVTYSDYSNVISQYLAALDSPIGLRSSGVTYTSFTALWNVVTDASYYTVDVATDEQFTNLLSSYEEVSTNSTSLEIENLVADTRYYTRVKAYNEYTNSAYSETITTVTTTVDAPVAQLPASTYRYKIHTQWSLVPNADSYLLDISTNSNFNTFLTGYKSKTIPGTSSIIDDLQPTTTYYYRVRAVVNGNVSEYSNTIATTTDDISTHQLAGKIETEDFIHNLGIDRIPSATASGGYYLGSIHRDDSVGYQIDVPYSGAYNVELRVANNSGSTTNVGIQKGPNTSLAFIPNTGDWDTWTTVSTTFNFQSSGVQTIWLTFSGGTTELSRIDWINLQYDD